MSSSKKNSELNDIVKGFKMFSSDNNGLINPNELKEIMETMNMDEKSPFIYNIIVDLCSDPEIQQKGGIDAGDFISSLDQELDDTSSVDGLQNIFSIFSNSSTNTIPLQIFNQIDEEDNSINAELNKIKNLISKPEINGKELDFQEFNEIMKDGTQKENEQNIYIKKYTPREGYNSNLKSSNYEENNNKLNNNETGDNRSSLINEDDNKNENNNYRYRKARPQKSFPVNDNNNYDVNNFDNSDKIYKKNNIESEKEQEGTKTKKKYRHMLSSKNKEKINEKMDNNNNKELVENHIKYEENSGEKSDKAERRYHRRYREVKSSVQDKNKIK